MKFIQCEKLDNPPVGLADVSDKREGFNVHVDQMDLGQWYSFQYDLEAPVYIQLGKDQTLIFTTKKPAIQNRQSVSERHES